ncbi:family 16 glycoside hydrolase [Prevotella sp. MA2016]|uniref:family 16 glycoside hydrolase n=1 Tax=Prevotella sp. MA2016 TaxID=1408310 RepID=UPI00055AA6DE|nr:family 16 glycoside hydrolase [Prevotella sp. MA2016]
MKKLLLCACLAAVIPASGQNEYQLSIQSNKPSGIINEMLYGQLFEHIYFSANNGVWQELIQERSFEPEQYPGIHPRDGYFDGWYMDDDQVLHSPTRYEQPLRIDSIDTTDFDLTMDVNWRAYKLARRSWSGGLMDLRFAFRNKADGSPYYLRIHDPYYESRTFTPAQTQAQIEAAAAAKAQAALQQQAATADFSICRMEMREVPGWGGSTRRINTLVPLVSAPATKQQINEQQQWHKLRIKSRGSHVVVYWDEQQVLACNDMELASRNFITFWVNYTEATYRNIRLSAPDGRVFFEGTPGDVRLPEVAQQWQPFGTDARYRLVKDDAVNMRYSQVITAGKGEAGLSQGPQHIVAGEQYVGSICAKGKGVLSVGLRDADGRFVARRQIGSVGRDWRKYDFVLEPQENCEGDFAIVVEKGSVQVDMATMTTRTGKNLGGFRPDILQAVKELHPTCLRWPGGGYVAQYDWQWGIGPQENRERWAHWMWMDYDQNCFGTDEFIRFCREVGSEPVIVVSVKFERPADEYERILQDAVNWLRYCNAPATDEWGAKRAANGHPEPYNVKYWEIDNEMWEMGIERYEKCVRDFSTAMRKVDPRIKIIACGGFREDEQFIQRSGTYFDYLSLHHYEQQGGYASGPVRLGQQYDRYAQMIAAGPNPNIKLFISEWNLNSIDWRTGLFAGGFLNMCEARDVVAMGAAALFLRRTDAPDWNNAFINFDYKDLFKAPNCQVTELWYDHFSKYRLAHNGETGDISVSTTLSENGADVIVKVVNPTDTAATLRIKGDWTGVARTQYDYYAPGSLLVANSMADKHAVALQSAVPPVEGCDVILQVPALSAGVLTITKKAAY